MTENNNFSRRALLRTAGGAAIAAFLPRAPSFAQPIPSSVTLPGRPELLIKGGAVITVDPALGILEKADIHIRTGEIIAVGANLDAPGADGVVCGHIHHPEIKTIAGMLYCNDGDWVESCSALTEDAKGRLSLVHWTELAQLQALVAPSRSPVGRKMQPEPA